MRVVEAFVSFTLIVPFFIVPKSGRSKREREQRE